MLVTLFEDPLSWRVRRLDEISVIDLRNFRATYYLDFRLRRSLIVDAVGKLKSSYEQANATARKTSIKRIETALASGGSQQWDTVDLLIPVIWSPGPLMNLRLEYEGRNLASLTRREVADLMSRNLLLRLFRHGYDHALVPDKDKLRDLYQMWRDLGWCLTAADRHALGSQRPLRTIRLPFTAPGNVESLTNWMVENFCRAGYLDAHARLAVDRRRDEFAGILEGAEGYRIKLTRLQIMTRDPFVQHDAFDATLNPLLLHQAYVKLMEWGERGPRDGGQEPHPDRVMDGFLGMCSYWMEALHLCMGAIEHDVPSKSIGREGSGETQLGARIAQSIVATVAKIGSSWPIIVRVTVPVEHTVRFIVQQDVPLPKGSITLDMVSGPENPVVRRAVRTAASWPRFLVELGKGAVDLVSVRRKGRPPGRSLLLGAVGYPITLNDALSYHIELPCDVPELDLVSRSAFISWPARNMLARHWRERWRYSQLRYLFPLQRIDVGEVFGRVTDLSPERHHYYSDKPGVGQPPGVAARQDQLLPVFGNPWLVVRYRVTRYVAWTNALAAATVALLALVMLRVSMRDAMAPGTTADFSQLLSWAAPVFVVIVLVFAVQQHRSRLVDFKIRFQTLIVVISYSIALAATVGWFVTERTSTLWPGFQTLGGWWAWLSGWIVGRQLWLVAHWIRWILVPAVAILGSWTFAFLVIWGILARVGAKRDARFVPLGSVGTRMSSRGDTTRGDEEAM